MKRSLKAALAASPRPTLAAQSYEALRSAAPDSLRQVQDLDLLVHVLGLTWPLSRFVISHFEDLAPLFSPEGRHAAPPHLIPLPPAGPARQSAVGPTGGEGGPPVRPPAERPGEGSGTRSESTATPNPADLLSQLRIARQKATLAMLVRDLAGEVDQTACEADLTELADGIVNRAMEMQRARSAPEAWFSVLAMGKFGGREMTYESDVDVVLLHLGGEGYPATRAAQAFVRDLSLVAEEGTLYSVDTELRPHGNAGVLVASDQGFLQYHSDSKDLWERQALIKARPVGPWEQPARLSRALENLVYVPRDEADTLRQVHDMKLKIEQAYVHRNPNVLDIKNAPGGIVDIEFIAQAGQLVLGHSCPEVRVGSTRPALDALAHAGWLEPEQARALRDAYDELKRVQGRLRLVSGRPENRVWTLSPDLDALCRSLSPRGRVRTAQEFVEALRVEMNGVRAIYKKKF
ncbi:MAG: hypothetical protein HYY13_05310 [Nitrospirae bacterium]|nr:hypothetical protein [Nitrospirota bacterium]